MTNKLQILRLAVCAVCVFMLSTSSFCASATRTYTIGGVSPDFTTIKAAWNALVATGSGENVIFDVRPGVYNETLVFDFELVDSYTRLTLKGNGATITSSDPAATLTVKSGNMEINGVAIENTSNTGSALYIVDNMMGELKNAKFKSKGGTVVKLYESSDWNITGCDIEGGDYGVSAYNSSMLYFHNNYVSKFTTAGFWADTHEDYVDHLGYELIGNHISSANMPLTSATNEHYGICILDGGGTNYFENNEITLQSKAPDDKTYGVYLSETSELTVKQNYISVFNRGTVFYAEGASNADFTNNTFIGNSGLVVKHTGSAKLLNNAVTAYINNCIDITGTIEAINNSTFLWQNGIGSAFKASGYLKLVNNAFVNFSDVDTSSAINISSARYCDYNDLYSLTPVLGYYNGQAVSSFQLWQGITGLDRNSISADPLFSDPELGYMEINTLSPLVGAANESYMPAFDNYNTERTMNTIGAFEPHIGPWYRSLSMNNVEVSFDVKLCSNGLLNVSIVSGQVSVVQVVIADALTGLQKINKNLSFGEGNKVRSVDTSSLPSGLYVVNITTASGTYSEKIYKR